MSEDQVIYEPIPVSGVVINKISVNHYLCADVTYLEVKNDGTKEKVTRNCQHPIHADLRKAIDNFKPHLVILTDSREMKLDKKLNPIGPENYTDEELEHVSIDSISISGDDSEKVSINGYKLKNSTSINLVTPKTSTSGTYQFSDELMNATEHLISEVEAYLNGKHAYKQLAIGFEGEEPAEE